MNDHADRIDFGRLAIPSFIVVVVVFAGLRLLSVEPWAWPAYDSYAYWLTRGGIDYTVTHQGPTGAYLYSPAFAQLIAPLTALPWPVFLALWTLLTALPLAWLAGRHALPALVLPPVFMSVALGQLDLAFAVVILVGLRWPAAWALPILTKLTPGIGLLWFVVRGEWRSLGIAALATVAIAAASAAADPSAWGAATDRRWVLPLGVCLSLPTVWLNTPTILVAILPMVASGARTPAGGWLRRSVPSIPIVPFPVHRRELERRLQRLRRRVAI